MRVTLLHPQLIPPSKLDNLSTALLPRHHLPEVPSLSLLLRILRVHWKFPMASILSMQRVLASLARLSPLAGALTASFGVAALSNLINNLPAGLLTADVLRASAAHPYLHHALGHALLIGVDLGPNLSVSGSLATILWLIALRRDGTRVSAWSFIKAGALVMPPALLVATAGVVLAAGR